jgi:SHS2 domain-containing protein
MFYAHPTRPELPMPYRYLDDVATADIAFIAEGHDLTETFIAASEATMHVMVENIDAIEPHEKRLLVVDHEHLDMLLFNLLQELIFYKDAEQLMLRITQVDVEKGDGSYTLHARASGEILDPERHVQRADVKAVTLHQFRLTEKDGGWEAMVILDI